MADFQKPFTSRLTSNYATKSSINVSLQRIRGVYDYALYKSTFYLLTHLNVSLHYFANIYVRKRLSLKGVL